jgi:hypothetical protein
MLNRPSKHQVNGLFGRLKQMLVASAVDGKSLEINCPVYVNVTGAQSDRARFVVNSLWRSKAGDAMASGFVRREDGTVQDRTMRIDRLCFGNVKPNRKSRFFSMKRNFAPVL